MKKDIKDVINSFSRDKVNQILYELSESNMSVENYIRAQVSDREEIFEMIMERIDSVRKQINFFNDADEYDVKLKLDEIIYLIKSKVPWAEDVIILLYHFFNLDGNCCENILTDGFIEMVFTEDATDLFVEKAQEFTDKEKLLEIYNDLVKSDSYGCRLKLKERSAEIFSNKAPNKKSKLYEFYIELNDFEPKTWRRFVIDSEYSMKSLASLIIASNNAEASHIYSFDVPCKNLDVQIYIDENSNAIGDAFRIEKLKAKPRKHVNARDVKIKDCVEKTGDKFSFTYDFGDDWNFTLKLEEIMDDYDSSEELPVFIIEGEGLGIIEDCGGPHALMDIKRIFEEKTGEEYESYCTWLGKKTLNLSRFNKTTINKNLKKKICKIDRLYD